MRKAGDEDRAAVIALWEACGLTRPWNDATADFTRAVEGTGSDILLFEQDGRLAATVMVGDDGHRGWVYYLGVAPDQRGSGLGRIDGRCRSLASRPRRAQNPADGARRQ